MADKKQNEKSFPEVFYARHIQEGVVDYPEENEMNYISNDTLTKMAKSFDGKPVFVRHQDVDMANLKDQMDGVVSENFYNKYDGCWWVKMIIMSDEGKEAISRNFGVSNCYTNIKRGLGGTWHGVKYDAEIVDGEYEHLAIVENPRYENAIILTEDGYNNYIEELKSKLDKKMNSKRSEIRSSKTEEKHMNPFKLFQKKINEASIDDIYVDLGGGGHMLLKEALDKYEELRNADAEEEAKANRKFANGDDEVGLHDGTKVKISDVIERLNKCNKCNEKPEEEDEKDEEKENESEPPVAEEDEKAPEEDKENEAEEEKAEDKENESEEEEKENEAEEEDKENEVEEETEEEKEEKKQNSSELRKAYLNSGMSADIKDRAEFKAGKELLNGYERAKMMGI